MGRGVLIAAAIASLLAGCVVGPEHRAPSLDLPSRWHRAAASAEPTAAILGEWWRDLRDPVLDRLMERAVAGNLDVAAAKAKIREARASRREAIGGLLPSVEASGSATRRRTAAASTGSSPVVSNLFQGGFDAAWELDLFGARARTVEAAGAAEAASEDDLDAALLTLVGDVATSYAEVRGFQSRIASARRSARPRSARSQRETARLTRTKFEAGSASAVDVAKAEAAAASTEADIPVLETSTAQAVHRLSVLTGAAPGTLASDLDRPGAIPIPRKGLPKGVPADVLRNRPDVRAAERRLAQYTAKVGVAEAALYPSVDLAGSISTSATRLGDLGRASTIAWSWGPSVSVPIFEGGRLVAVRDGAEAVRDQYLIAWRKAVLTALEDVENALVALAQDRVRVERTARAVEGYRKAAALSRDLYRNGSASFLDVLDAERSLYTAEDTLVQARVAVATDHVALAKALGGGWVRPVETSAPETPDEDRGPRLRIGGAEP